MWYDLLIVAILVITAARGAMKGFVWQLAAIGSLVLCFLFATPLSLALAPAIGVDPPLNRWIALLVIYSLFAAVAFGAARMLREGIEKAKFVEYDRHLGAVFGLLKGVVISLVLTFFAVTLSDTARAHIMESKSGYAAAIIMDGLHPVMPAELHAVLEPYIHQLDRPDMDLKHSHHGDSDEHLHGDPFGSTPRDDAPGDDPFARDRQPANREPVRRADADRVWAFAASLIGKTNEEIRTSVLDFVAATTPEQRAALIEQLGLAIPDLARIIAPTSRPTGTTTAGGSSSELRVQRDRLLSEIAEVYSDSANARQAMIADVQRLLTGVPDQVVVAVLRDWESDLLSLDPSGDPDPETSIATPLDVRIVRQLAAARVPLSSLGGSLQERLRGVERR